MDLDKTIVKLQKQLDVIPLNHTRKRSMKRDEIERRRLNMMKSLCKRNDGQGRTQILRMGQAKLNETWVEIPFVFDFYYASQIYIDELHAAASSGTITYAQIVRPHLHQADLVGYRRPGIVGITGSALADGYNMIVTFARELRSRDSTGDELTAKLVKSAWDKIEWAFKEQRHAKKKSNKSVSDKQLFKQLMDHDDVAQLFNEIRSNLQSCFIARSYQSKDPWQRTLPILDGTVRRETIYLTHEPKYHTELKNVEGEDPSQGPRRPQCETARVGV
jgi:hypothetical protein